MTARTLMTHRLIIVDKDPRYAEWLRHHLSVVYPDATLSLLTPDEFARAIPTLTYDECELVLLSSLYGEHPDDPRSEGIVLLRDFRTRPTFPAVLTIAEEGNELTAVRALQLGAVDYLPKRLLTPDRLKSSVRLALRRVERRVARRAKLAQSGDHAAPVVTQATSAPPADLIPGYSIRSTIGESEKAVVYLAHSESLGRDVALKVSLGDADSDSHKILEREFAAVARIRHPAVVELHDYGVHAGREYLAMEYFPLGDLKSRMHRGISEGEALRFVENIASALRVVHHAGILHRDLKPPNVMLRENDDVALIDFGLARNLEGGLQSTRTGVLRGSPYYMSPEQALGEPLDARTDLYSLGIIFYEMLTGKKPFAGSSAIEVLQEHVNAPVPQLPERHAIYQPMLDRMLAKSRDQRFASAEEVIEAFGNAREARARPAVTAA
ncbi:MAG TPA: protein kinase [Steroidobacteraceae bacterium]|nr:protein kinase [Steroidobacteraceae bacterium]